MFESLSDRLEKSFKLLKGQGRISEINIAETLKEVRRALLDADVNFKIAKQFTDMVKTKAIGQEVIKSVNPSQMMIKIVHDELVELMGRDKTDINIKVNPSVILIAGLQGSGKTTFSGKLALWAQSKKGRNPMLVAGDVYRPAAIEQLRVLGTQIGIPVYTEEDNKNPVQIARNAVREAKMSGRDVVIIDTAGRLGMGDIVSLVEKAQEQFDTEEARKLQKKIAKDQFDFNDFISQIQQIKKMGNVKDLMSMIPGVGKSIKDLDIDDNAFKGIEAIIRSMTPQERTNPGVLNGSRRKRIASGSGTTVQDVNRLLKQFDETRRMMKLMTTNKNAARMMGKR